MLSCPPEGGKQESIDVSGEAASSFSSKAQEASEKTVSPKFCNLGAAKTAVKISGVKNASVESIGVSPQLLSPELRGERGL